MTIEQLFVFVHIIGTIFGVGGATMIEAHIKEALKDRLVTDDERAILGIDYRMVRIGLILCLMTGFGFITLDVIQGATTHLYSPRLWAKILMVVIIAANTLLLQAHLINLYWGSAISFVSWWSAAFFGMFITHKLKFDFYGTGGFLTTFSSLMTFYIVTLVAGAYILHLIRTKMRKTV